MAPETQADLTRPPQSGPAGPRYDLAAAGANDGLWDWDLERDRLYVSSRWRQLLGYETDLPEVGTQRTWFDRVHPNDISRLRADLATFLAEPCHGPGRGAGHFSVEYRIRHKEGHWVWVLCRAAVLRDELGRAIRLAGSHTDLTDRKQADRLCRDAYHDSLTGLANRALLMDRLGQCLRRSARHSNYRFAVLALDVDRLRAINDSLGQGAGDELLAIVSTKLNACVRGLDLVARAGQPGALARVGGDEFVVVLDGIADGTAAVRVAERVQAALARPLTVAGREVFCTASIGVALGGGGGYEKPEDLLRDAEAALYAAKAAGPGRCQVFDPGQHAAVMAKWRTENDLRGAIDRGELLLHFQPVIDLGTGELAEFEALVRWPHAERGLVPPGEFIPLAEETGLVVPLGFWVLREACRHLKRWLADRPDAPVSVAVNVSPKQFAQPGLVDDFARIIREVGVPARLVRLEITESCLLQDGPEAKANLARLRELELQLHLDDFGTGYSSLASLHRLPISALKIDRSFVSTLGSDPVSASLIDTIMALATRLELQVIAEGVETEDQAAALRNAGVGCGQGYLFARPMEAAAVDQLLARGRPKRAAVA